ncbi:hypothetical protein BTA15_06875 [Vibrio parahaemolyticus]|nr:hypothetical protein BTA15_06875 [Vibrio parahaemolyticus]
MHAIYLPLLIFTVYAVVNSIIGFFLGERKLNKGVAGAIFGFIFAFIPPLNFIFLALLYFKKNAVECTQLIFLCATQG